MIAIQDNDQQALDQSQETSHPGALPVLATRRMGPFNDRDQHPQRQQVDKIRQQFRARGVAVEYVKHTEATRTTTYFFTLAEDRLADITKIDETLERMLESSLETSGISILAPVPDSALIAVTAPKKTDIPVTLC